MALLGEHQRTVWALRAQRNGNLCNYRVHEWLPLVSGQLTDRDGQRRGRKLDAHVLPG